MLEPIIDNKFKEKDEPQFHIDVVKEFSKNPEKFKEKYDFPLRHYSQIVFDFFPENIKKLLERIDINPSGITVTVFGGYTGQFAKALREVGFSVVFTDPIKEYVIDAKKNGFEAYQYSIEELPGNFISKSDLFSTFECYMPFNSPETSVYTTLRLLSAERGFIFAESKSSRNELKNERGTAQFKSHFKPFEDYYSIKRCHRDFRGLRFYYFNADKNAREKIILDCKIMKLLYDATIMNMETPIDKELISNISIKLKMRENKVIESIRRIKNVYHRLIPISMRLYFPNSEFNIFSKRFIFHA